jgi:biotin transport system substrate-specific component
LSTFLQFTIKTDPWYRVAMNNRKTILIALFGALTIVGAYIRFPLPPVPVTLQTMFVILAGMLGGKRIGTASTAIYLLLGAIGLPVFTAGGGIGILLGPTGGYLLALPLAAFLAGAGGDAGYRTGKKRAYRIGCLAGGLAATVAIYLVGVPFLKYNLDMDWGTAIKAGMLPFLVGDTVKLVVATMLASSFSDRIRTFAAQTDGQ